MSKAKKSAGPKGCSFLVTEVGGEPIFTPERVTDDQRMFASAAQEFMEREVLPHVEDLEKMKDGLMARMLRKAGEAGLLMAEIPEAYGGLDLDKVTVTLLSEQVSRYGSFGAAMGAHTTIGTLPIVFFGNAEQKGRFLPKLATGEWLAAYALTEPGSGSDALGAKTTAVLAEDGTHYVLNGQKIWITNAGFADVFIVFAKVDGEHFTGFIVESSRGGVSLGEEERKMGLKGSSTRQVFLDNVRVPVENVLGEVGKGHKIAFNILNLGRLKLGAGSVGASKRVFEMAVRYANERHQFKRPISSFGAIQKKLAEMAAMLFAGEAMIFRVAGAMDQSLGAVDKNVPEQAMGAIEEFAIEASILKVWGSEAIAFITDEALQIHGGMGFSAEYDVERVYRDIRVNRIFEGTNEINRMLIPGMVLKRMVKGELDLFSAIQKVEKALGEPTVLPAPGDSPAGVEAALTEIAKKLVLMTANVAIQRYMTTLRDQQQLLLTLADLISELYVMDSTVARVQQLHAAGKARRIHDVIASVLCTEGYRRVLSRIDGLMPSLAEGEALAALDAKVNHFRVRTTLDLIVAKREIAAYFIELEKYNL